MAKTGKRANKEHMGQTGKSQHSGRFKPSFRDFSGGSLIKNLPSNVGDMGSTPGQEARIPRVAGQLSPVCCS